MEELYDFDVIIIGSGPSGQKAAIQAAKLGRKAAIVDQNSRVGGVSLYDGTIPSKSFREAIIHLSGYKQRGHYGKAYRVKQNIHISDLTNRSDFIIRDVEQNIRSQFIRNNVSIFHGSGSLVDPTHVKIAHGNTAQIISARFIVIATGTRPWHPPGFEFDNQRIVDSDGILHLKELPRSLSIVGGGVIGCEYGSMFSVLGVKVTIVEAGKQILGFADRELVDILVYKLREQKGLVIVNDPVVRCAKSPDNRTVMYLESGKRIVSDILLVSAGRVGNVQGLNLGEFNIEFDQRGRIKVNEHFQTTVPNIYAVGDIIGHPALASTGHEQGRRAILHAFGMYDQSYTIPIPYGIYTIPEIFMVGKTESELAAEKIPFETGIAHFSENERDKIAGEDSGILKILFHRSTLQVLGVHVIGDGASELIHIGQAVMAFHGGIDYLANAVFNYPTVSQSYKGAALDGLNKIIDTAGLPEEDPYAS